MSYFEECLATGQWLSQEERQALYRYLLTTKREAYIEFACIFLNRGVLSVQIANGEILYSLNENRATFECRKAGAIEFSPVIRELKLGKSKRGNVLKLKRFFAQCEVDAIGNFPIKGKIPQDLRSINVYRYPFYDLNYYSNGRGRALGLLKKLRTRDSDLLVKLRTL